MNPAPPPLPKAGIPKWVWILTVSGVLFIAAMYTAIFWGYAKITDLARTGMQQYNPDFEMLYLSNQGKVKVRHKPTGKEFLVNMSGRGMRIPLRGLLTRAATPVPPWLQLKDATPYRSGWDRMGDTGMLIDALQDLFADHDFIVESQDKDKNLMTACNPKLLRCAVVAYHLSEDAANRSWYSVSYFEAP